MASVASQLIEEVTAHAQSDNLEEAREICADGRAQLKPDGTRWRTVGEVKGKHASGVGNQYSCTLPQNMVYPALLPLLPLMRTPRLPVVDWTDTPPI